VSQHWKPPSQSRPKVYSFSCLIDAGGKDPNGSKVQDGGKDCDSIMLRSLASQHDHFSHLGAVPSPVQIRHVYFNAALLACIRQTRKIDAVLDWTKNATIKYASGKAGLHLPSRSILLCHVDLIIAAPSKTRQ
jgi:hypothetical protein